MLTKGNRIFIREATGHAYEGVFDRIEGGRVPRIVLIDAVFVALLDHDSGDHDVVELEEVHIIDDAASVIHHAVVHPDG